LYQPIQKKKRTKSDGAGKNANPGGGKEEKRKLTMRNRKNFRGTRKKDSKLPEKRA